MLDGDKAPEAEQLYAQLDRHIASLTGALQGTLDDLKAPPAPPGPGEDEVVDIR